MGPGPVTEPLTNPPRTLQKETAKGTPNTHERSQSNKYMYKLLINPPLQRTLWYRFIRIGHTLAPPLSYLHVPPCCCCQVVRPWAFTWGYPYELPRARCDPLEASLRIPHRCWASMGLHMGAPISIPMGNPMVVPMSFPMG
jgi:hypothetical protein